MDVDVRTPPLDLVFENRQDGRILEASSPRSNLFTGLYSVRLLSFADQALRSLHILERCMGISNIV